VGIFKAYDIRGIYGEDFSEDIAYKVGFFVASELDAKRVVVSRDMRVSSPSVAAAVARGAADAGAHCMDVGLASTPMNYFSIVHLDADAGFQVTASHNPVEYNGIKISRRGAEPMGYHSGLADIERLVAGTPVSPVGDGKVEKENVLDAYAEHVASRAGDMAPLTLVVDAANGMGGMTLPPILERLPVKVIPLFFELDGSFPNHDANPLKEENLAALAERVRDEGAELGAAFDGDADRCVFTDENGAMIRGDLATAILGPEMVRRNGGGKVIYDVRSSRAVREEVEAAGGEGVRERVGHAFIKATMKKLDALFGGELAGHYYFKENFYADSAAIALIRFLEILSSSGKKASELVEKVARYPSTGETNFEVDDKDAVIDRISKEFSDARQDALDGLTCEYEDWWLNLRKSNTEPLLRLIVEAKDRPTLDAATSRVIPLIR
jgi:phosphomannomutase